MTINMNKIKNNQILINNKRKKHIEFLFVGRGLIWKERRTILADGGLDKKQL